MIGFAEGNDVLSTAFRPIDRLPARATANNEQKEAMNCKSCRKHAIPKKRGPKTDVLEALLKRVNGLEKRLKNEQKSTSPDAQSTSSSKEDKTGSESGQSERLVSSSPHATPLRPEVRHAKASSIPVEATPHIPEAIAFTDALLDTFFARVHNKPYYILDETATRHRLRNGRLPRFLINAINAVSIRYVPLLCGGHGGAVRSSHDYALRSRAEIDVDEPSIDNLQALLLLAMANFQNGRGKKCYMGLTHAVSTAFALDLHRELPNELRISNLEREGRRKLFWTCYLMDRFTVSGSKRPSLISDDSVHLRLPGWQPSGSQTWVEGDFFPNGSSLPYASGVSSASLGSGAMLIEIVRVLGVTNRYLVAGGVKGDSHFPWHAQSTLSRIRSDLDCWAAATRETFSSIDALFGSHDSSTLVLSKLIYHLIHCLIYRPFLPIDLNELSGTGQSQSWQIEATNMCFLNANAIAELVEIGKATALLDWPSFVGYCVCTAGTVHIHGAHYVPSRDGDVFRNSAEFLEREMSQLLELRTTWAAVQHQRDTLQVVYASHAQLVKSLASHPTRFSPVFQMGDFFDRYPGASIDGAYATFSDVIIDASLNDAPVYYGRQQLSQGCTADQSVPEASWVSTVSSRQTYSSGVARKPMKRRSTSSSLPYPTPKPAFERNEIEQEVPESNAGSKAQLSGVADGVVDGIDTSQALFEITLSPSFAFGPIHSSPVFESQPGEQQLLHGASDFGNGMTGEINGNSEHGNNEGGSDPFLSLLEQLAENDTSGLGGFEDFDFFADGSI